MSMNIRQPAIGNATGSASNANKWTIPRTLILTGDTTGSASINGTTDITLSTVSNHALKADKWATPRTLALSNDLSGSVSFDGTTNVTLSAVTLTKYAALIVGDDTLVQTTNTTPSAVKNVRFTSMNDNLAHLDIYLSIWNATSSAITTVSAAINSTATQSATTSATTESMVKLLDFPISPWPAINELVIYIQTSNASYSAYQQLTEVIGSNLP